MDEMDRNNQVRLVGVPAGRPAYSHSSRGIDFFSFPLCVQRLSGNSDTLNILLRREQLETLEVADQGKLCVVGEVRSFNSRRSTGARLVITVLARELNFCDEEDDNRVFLTGTLCKAPVLRSTPMGREICARLELEGRLQSRNYIKMTETGPVEKTAFEISAIRVGRIDP